jgi:hypothetical protein
MVADHTAATISNIAGLDRTSDLQQGDYQSLLASRHPSLDHGLIFSIAPPWDKSLDEVAGLDLRRTMPAVTDIFRFMRTTYPNQRVLLAAQVYEKLNPTSLRGDFFHDK